MPLQPQSLKTFAIFILPLLLLSLIPLFNMATKPSNNNLNGEHPLPSKDIRKKNHLPRDHFKRTIHTRPNQSTPIFYPSTLTTYRASNSPQEASRPLLSKAHDRFLPRRLLSCGSRRRWKPRCRWYASNSPSPFPPN